MADVGTPLRSGEPPCGRGTPLADGPPLASARPCGPPDEEVAAALAALHLALRRRRQREAGASRWMRAGRAESVAALAEPAGWATIERAR